MAQWENLRAGHLEGCSICPSKQLSFPIYYGSAYNFQLHDSVKVVKTQ